MQFQNISILKVIRWFFKHEPAKPDLILICPPYEYTFLMHIRQDLFTPGHPEFVAPLIRINAYDNSTFDDDIKAVIGRLTPNSLVIAEDDVLETIRRLAARQSSAASTA